MFNTQGKYIHTMEASDYHHSNPGLILETLMVDQPDMMCVLA